MSDQNAIVGRDAIPADHRAKSADAAPRVIMGPARPDPSLPRNAVVAAMGLCFSLHRAPSSHQFSELAWAVNAGNERRVLGLLLELPHAHDQSAIEFAIMLGRAG